MKEADLKTNRAKRADFFRKLTGVVKEVHNAKLHGTKEHEDEGAVIELLLTVLHWDCFTDRQRNLAAQWIDEIQQPLKRRRKQRVDLASATGEEVNEEAGEIEGRAGSVEDGDNVNDEDVMDADLEEEQEAFTPDKPKRTATERTQRKRSRGGVAMLFDSPERPRRKERRDRGSAKRDSSAKKRRTLMKKVRPADEDDEMDVDDTLQATTADDRIPDTYVQEEEPAPSSVTPVEGSEQAISTPTVTPEATSNITTGKRRSALRVSSYADSPTPTRQRPHRVSRKPSIYAEDLTDGM